MSTSHRKSCPDHRLTNTIGKHGSVDEFYNSFNLVDTEHANLSFGDMQQICFMDGMDQWPKLVNPNGSVQLSFFLHSFLPSGKEHFPSLFEKVENLFFSLFVNKEDHEAVQVAMASMPTMALFMTKSNNKNDTQQMSTETEGEIHGKC
jgi:hypothetical protein